MIPEFEILEHIGVGPIRLGADRAAVAAAVAAIPDNGLDQTAATIDYAFGNSLQIEYGSSGHAQFIGVGYYAGCGCDFTFRGQHIGDYSAEALFDLLSALDGQSGSQFQPNEFYFRTIHMNVWDADSQYDYRGGKQTPVYGQVGVSSPEYHSSET
jgi:hypothetical protein